MHLLDFGTILQSPAVISLKNLKTAAEAAAARKTLEDTVEAKHQEDLKTFEEETADVEETEEPIEKSGKGKRKATRGAKKEHNAKKPKTRAKATNQKKENKEAVDDSSPAKTIKRRGRNSVHKK